MISLLFNVFIFAIWLFIFVFAFAISILPFARVASHALTVQAKTIIYLQNSRCCCNEIALHCRSLPSMNTVRCIIKMFIVILLRCAVCTFDTLSSFLISIGFCCGKALARVHSPLCFLPFLQSSSRVPAGSGIGRRQRFECSHCRRTLHFSQPSLCTMNFYFAFPIRLLSPLLPPAAHLNLHRRVAATLARRLSVHLEILCTVPPCAEQI